VVVWEATGILYPGTQLARGLPAIISLAEITLPERFPCPRS
jgi:hypothetical protein